MSGQPAGGSIEQNMYRELKEIHNIVYLRQELRDDKKNNNILSVPLMFVFMLALILALLLASM